MRPGGPPAGLEGGTNDEISLRDIGAGFLWAQHEGPLADRVAAQSRNSR